MLFGLWVASKLEAILYRGRFMSVGSVSQGRKATNVSLSASLLVEAKALRINVSQAAEAGLAQAVADRRAELWLQANREAIDSSNAYVESHGLPLAGHRHF